MSKQIELTRGKYATVDDEDYERLSRHKWHCMKKGYAARRLSVQDGGGIVMMHRIIMNAPTGSGVDHVNRNKLDNRKDNLRLATNSQNQANQPPGNNNTTGYRGVSRTHKHSGYIAQISVNKKYKYLGCFRDPIDAARAYDKAALELFGEFAYINGV